uniref:Uncharacterized protein n=1 Tax=Salvator merianae TaxID=96440 RepID=A0A8D0BMQ6_SALMN
MGPDRPHPSYHCVGQATVLYLDTGTSAFAHSIRHGSTGWINHGHEPNKTEVVNGKVDIITVKGKTLGVLLFRQVKVAKTLKIRRRYRHSHMPCSS